MITAKTLPARVDAAIERVLHEERVVGCAVRIAHRGELILARDEGLADREASKALKRGDIFRLASLSKTLVSAAAMALIERGRLKLEEPVTKYLPGFEPKLANGTQATITVRHLLTHTSGLTYNFFQPADGPYARAGIGDGIVDRGISLDEELKRLTLAPLLFAPGRMWNYSVAIDVLGALIASAHGKSLPDAVRELITAPLGLADTGFKVADLSRLVVPYGDAKPPKRMGEPHEVEFSGLMLRFSPGRILDERSFPSGGAGMAGTADEYVTFLETIRKGGGPILKSETVKAMMSNQIGDVRVNLEPTPAWGFGFGGAVLVDAALAQGPQSAGTYKWGGVYGHHWYIDPSEELTVLCMTNTAVEGMSGAFVAELMTAVYGN